MEARDSGSKIRPLPVDDIDGAVPQRTPIEPKRRWAPLIVIVAGALAFGVIARGLSVGDSSEVGTGTGTTEPPALSNEPPPPTTTTTTEPPPARLREMLPIADEGLRLVALTPSSARVGQWDAELAFPSYNARISQPRSAEFNSAGTRVAVHTWGRDGSFVLDAVDGGSPAYIDSNVTSGTWHPSEPDLFAWTQAISSEDGNETVIRVADLTGVANTPVEALIEFSVPSADHILVAWGDWGFATQNGNAVFGFDSDGLQTRAGEGVLFDAAADGTLLIGTMDDEGITPFLLHPDDSRTELPSLDIGASDFRITDDGLWVLAVTIQADGHTSVLARTVYSRSTRLTSIDDTAVIVDTAWDDRVLVLQEVHTNDLVFKDWNTGAEFRIPAEDQIGAIRFRGDSR